ncbi:MAG TPA: response regulator [Candidatus Angelobacter sp.]|nr:response regulator [Candidatus Angelobacter sp.]
MSLRILFADDSMTAQNMGKKILSEAGYEVVAVSNGAAAVKKIAEQKPDIIILDVYMPGYSGLEVCEKVRGSLDTLKTPVLLTVGKMEPYKPEDANRVKADGVIIKPFEASDLLAIVKKFEERIAQTPPPPIVEQTVRLERQYQEAAITAPETPMEHHSTGKTGMQPMVEVPDHMASSAAFTDMLGADLPSVPQHFAVNTPAAAFETSVIVPVPPVPATDYETPVAWKEKDEETAEPVAAEPISAMRLEAKPIEAERLEAERLEAEPVKAEPEIIATPVTAAAEPVAEAAAPEPQPDAAGGETVVAGPSHQSLPAHPQFIPVFKEPEQPVEAASYEVMPTSAPPIGEIEIPREPTLQETADVTTRNTVADRVEPGLLSTIGQQMGTRPTTPNAFSAEHISAAAHEEAPAQVMETAAPERAPAEISAPETAEEPGLSAPLPMINATSEVSDSDFEARVAAAMAAYSHAAEPASAPTSVAVAESPAPSVEHGVEAAHVAAEPVPSFEYHTQARAPEAALADHAASVSAREIATEPVLAKPVLAEPVAAERVAAPATPEQVATEPAAVHDAISSGVEAAAVAAAAETGAEHHTIAQAIHRVMERLKPELVEEIMRELKSKK